MATKPLYKDKKMATKKPNKTIDLISINTKDSKHSPETILSMAGEEGNEAFHEKQIKYNHMKKTSSLSNTCSSGNIHHSDKSSTKTYTQHINNKKHNDMYASKENADNKKSSPSVSKTSENQKLYLELLRGKIINGSIAECVRIYAHIANSIHIATGVPYKHIPYFNIAIAIASCGATIISIDEGILKCNKLFFHELGETFVQEWPITTHDSRAIIASVQHPKRGTLNVVSYDVSRAGENDVRVDFEYYSSKGVRYEERTYVYNVLADSKCKQVLYESIKAQTLPLIVNMPKSCPEDHLCITDLTILPRLPKSSNETKACDE